MKLNEPEMMNIKSIPFYWPDLTLVILCAFQVVTCPNASFTDLAEIVSRIEPVKPAVVDGKAITVY